jgi:hypothetical protein
MQQQYLFCSTRREKISQEAEATVKIAHGAPDRDEAETAADYSGDGFQVAISVIMLPEAGYNVWTRN